MAPIDERTFRNARRAGTGRRAVRLGWYTSQPPGVVTVISDFGADRFDLLIVPPGASQASADTAAADPTDRRHTPELIAEIAHAD
ncbi:hypothetical protein FHR83_003977 [Actinoplanes campanulatus]|uniref:Uncharacterized protein n=1 Tax=Actinoplanes campanulatus TaxID=113559 RepID=A0A7W5AHP1_9ACTN|nr:DUF5994 family protein [Actinoplanes campanulatus]MBB3096307.1 hypothetical protein [Actinoplanes campanulatus]GGN19209.1 hypothetical protein GCM10010109_32650 [Actinoplanes campanulatus]GID41603.1 hypothetical protein Aca09nite_81090 [Actinoplanes campanulatus]